METKVLDIKGKEKGTCALPESLFAVKANPTFLHEAIPPSGGAKPWRGR